MKNSELVIRQHIDKWSTKLGNLNWWPKFVYHFTDILNAVTVLESGYLYSRSKAIVHGLMQVDNASPEVIQQTLPEHLDYVRLYFRPKTPTQYRNEGIRPIAQREMGAHCGVPIFFCFDAFDILNLEKTEVSNGNMGSLRASHSGQGEFFARIPFHIVYHNGAFPNEDRDEIVFRRCAEILTPGKLQLEDNLRMICCRSVAERQTLLAMLSKTARSKWSGMIRIGEFGFYNRKWTYVEEVVTVGNSVIFRFNPNTLTPGPFMVKFSFVQDGEERARVWEKRREDLSNKLELNVPNATMGIVSLKLDDTLAFYGRVIFTEIPF